MVTRKKDPLLSSLPPFEDYFNQLDHEKIAAAILGPEGTPKMADYDLSDAKSIIWAAGEKFLPRDLYDMQITGIEEQYQEKLDFSWGSQVFRGIKDLKGVLNGRLNVTKKFAGKKVVIDWKTTGSTLDTTWDERLMDSWQWRKYLYFDQADVMIYRGLNRDGKTRELIIERPPDLEEQVLIQLEGVSLQRNALVKAGLTVYPRKMPGACGAFGRECPHWTACRTGTMRKQALSEDETFSYSSMDLFMLCPEKYRNSRLFKGEDDTEESIFGVRVHAGLAEMYSQSKELFQNGN